MNIGQAAAASGVSAKMIRYYESIGLVPAVGRRASGYRDYDESDVHRLAFVRRARDLGFSLEAIRDLLALWNNNARSDAEVRALALIHVTALEEQAKKLQGMITTLRALVSSCERGDRPGCPIIAELGHGRDAPALPVRAKRRA